MQYRHKETGSIVDAWKFDGTDEGASRITNEVHKRGGNLVWAPKGTFDYDLHHAYMELKDEETGDSQLVRPGFWVLDVSPEREGTFYVIFGDDFTELYEPVM